MRGRRVIQSEASQITSFPRRCGTARPLSLPVDSPRGGLRGPRPYTPAVRRWVCVVALLWGFTRQDYAWTARPRIPIPVERLLVPGRDPDLPEGAWWSLT